MKAATLIILLILVIFGIIIYNDYRSSSQIPVFKESREEGRKQIESTKTTPMEKPPMTIYANRAYTATLKTSKGDIVIQLHAKETPNTVNNFIYLAKKNFYNNTVFHRVIKGFMIQGGDPKGDGTGDPGYRFDDEPFQGGYDRGIVAMANAGPNTNGSQFFIMHAKQDLPPNYVIFGNVTQGLEVIDAIAEAPTTTNSQGEPSQPVNPVTVQSITISEQ